MDQKSAGPNVDSIAIQAGDIALVPPLVEEMLLYLDFPEHESHRLQLLRLARSLVQALETPRETVLRLCWAEVRIS
jgi:hypothetical protein